MLGKAVPTSDSRGPVVSTDGNLLGFGVKGPNRFPSVHFEGMGSEERFFRSKKLTKNI